MLQELYTGSNDCQIMVWGAARRSAEGDEGLEGEDSDAWSD